MDNLNEVTRREAYLIWEKDKCKSSDQCWDEAKAKMVNTVIQEVNTWGCEDL